MKLADLLKRLWRKRPDKYFDQIQLVKRVSEVPDEIGRDFYIVRRNGRDIWAVFQCPCERGHRLNINLSSQSRPYWKCKAKRGEITLSPSISLKYECQSHFWISHSRIYWVKDFLAAKHESAFKPTTFDQQRNTRRH